MSNQPRVVCLFDFDNTLFDNDALKADYTAELRTLLGEAVAQRFWEYYEQTRSANGTIDYPATMARLRPEIDPALADRVWDYIWNYPFSTRVFPNALAVLAHVQAAGAEAVVVSDGDAVYQPHKIRASGVAAAVHDHVKVFIHKQANIEKVFAWQPAEHYVMIDDKATILADLKRLAPTRFTTVHVRQGHYATEPADPPPDIQLAHIGDLLNYDLDHLTGTIR
jgi:hypothetical protein